MEQLLPEARHSHSPKVRAEIALEFPEEPPRCSATMPKSSSFSRQLHKTPLLGCLELILQLGEGKKKTLFNNRQTWLKHQGEKQERYSKAGRMIWAVIGTRSSKGSLARLANSPVEKDIFEIMGQICLGVAGSWMCPTDFPPKKGAVHILGTDPLGKEVARSPGHISTEGKEQLRAAWSSFLHSQVVTSLPTAAQGTSGHLSDLPESPFTEAH